MIKEPILLSVAICTRNRASFLKQSVQSVVPQLTADTELIVVDNGSADETRSICEQFSGKTSELIYLFEPRPGLSVARNTALRKAQGKYVLFLDDDAVAGPDWLDAYRKFILHLPSARIGSVGGGVVPRYDFPPPKWIGPKYGILDCGDQPLRLSEGGLWGCNSAYLREAAIALGLFDEQLGYREGVSIPSEDTDLQDRFISSGWECWWLPGANVQHAMPAERLMVKTLATSAFHLGRASAIRRLKLTPSKSGRGFLRAVRLAVAPFHLAINLLKALFFLFIGRQPLALLALCRGTRAAGWGWQVLQCQDKT